MIYDGAITRSAVAIALIACFPLLLAAGQQAVDEPWSVSSGDPVLGTGTNAAGGGLVVKFDLGCSLQGDFSYAWLRFYQKYLSSSWTVRCPMLPSCSRYSMQAINFHGAVKGIVMTADRLIHETDEKRWAVQIRNGNDLKYSDPIENNDFWWYKR